MSDNGKYPDWQKQIRKAQAQKREEEVKLEVEEQKKREQEQREKDAKDAANLKLLLSLLGIEAEPKSGEHEIDHYRFSLRIYQLSSKQDERAPDYLERFVVDIFNTSFDENEPDDWGHSCPGRVFSGGNILADPGDDWFGWQAKLADQLDELDEEYKRCKERAARLMAERATKTASNGPELPQPPTTPEERLLDALRGLISEMMGY